MDTEYFGNDITFIDGVQSALECQTKCLKEEKCNGFTWSEIADKSIAMPKNRCYLKDSIPNATIKSGVISGPKTCGKIWSAYDCLIIWKYIYVVPNTLFLLDLT